MKKTAVIFPGVGYTKDRPLLYYSGKLAVKLGYELKTVDFSGLKWSKEELKDRDFLLRTLDICLKKCDETLKDITDPADSDLVFISKSIGTVVATAFAKKNAIDALQICFSPLEMIGEYVRDNGALLFYGDADPFADHKAIESIVAKKDLNSYCIAGGNHSLETGDISTDIDNLQIIMRKTAAYMVK